MKLELVKNAVTSRVGRQILIGKKHSPTILFVGGVVGVVGTAVMASRATLKLDDILAESREAHKTARTLEHVNYSETDRKRDHAYIYIRTVAQVAKAYTPAVALGTISVCALTGSHVILTRRNVALTAAYSALEKGFSEYRERVVADLGKEKDREFRYGTPETREVVEETKTGTKVTTVKQPNGEISIYARFFDPTCSSWSKIPQYNQIFVSCQQNYANDLLRSRGHVFLNEVYDMLGIPRSKEGSIVGWLLKGKGDGYIDFGVFENDIWSATRFVNGEERSILLDFNVDGVIYDKI